MEEKLDTLMDKRLSQLEEAQQKFAQKNQISIPKIQRVPKFLRQNERFAKYCSPKIISFGPIHHKSEGLEEGEHYKLLWTSQFVAEYGKKIEQDTNQACQLLLKKIEDDIDELKNMFTEDAIEGYNDNDLAWILFVDGCSLLHFMENIDEQCPEALNLKFDRMMFMFRDAMLLENQLPSKMLDILCRKKGLNLEYCYDNYKSFGKIKRRGIRVESASIPLGYPIPFHILDSWRSYVSTNIEGQNQSVLENTILSEDVLDSWRSDTVSTNIEGQNQSMLENTILSEDVLDSWRSDTVSTNIEGQNQSVLENTILSEDVCDEELDFNWNTYKSIQDLKTVGIKVMKNEKDKWRWSNISFKSKWFSGELRLPIFLFNDVTPYFFRNLIAYEMCPDFHHNYECCSFLSFMDSLIDNAEDVKELRLAGVFQNLLGSDEELAKLFNDLGDDLPTKMFCQYSSTNAVAHSKKYIQIKRQIERHYTNKWKTWLAQANNTYFNTPWAMIAFLAASLALLLTFIQTWYAIHPK